MMRVAWELKGPWAHQNETHPILPNGNNGYITFPFGSTIHNLRQIPSGGHF
jgi:hypothetical protein